MKKTIVLLVVLFNTAILCAQVMTSPNPIPVGYTCEVTITFDATQGTGGMKGASKCYAHTGLITAASTNTGDWKNVIGSWRGTTQPQLTSLGNDKWQLEIPNIYTFYNVSTSLDIKALAFVFHDGPGGSKEGKSGAGDILIYLGEEIEADIWEAVEGVTAVSKTRPSGISNGIYYDANDPTKVTLCTYAASKTQAAKRVFLIGDMTDWKLSKDYQLYKDGNYFWITLTGLTPGKEYRFQYAVERADGVKKQICDLYSEKVLHPDDKYQPKQVDPTLIHYPMKGADGGYVTVIQPGKTPYEWSDATLNFKRPNKNNLVIYELWVYDYTPDRTFQGVIKRLDYLQNLGINAIELMPVSEFQYNESWGYNPDLYFAVDKTYGRPEDLKQLIDECHKRGIAVIVDMVFNHTNGLNPMAKLYPWTSEDKTKSELGINPWFNLNPPEGNNGYGDEEWNHDFGPAKEMFQRVFQYWLTEYKVDGFRLDLSHGLCGTSKNAVSNLIDYYRNYVRATSTDAYMILEHWGDNAGKEWPQLISYGMLCWTGKGLCEAYYFTTEGNLNNDRNGFEDANRDGYVSYCESHDEERMQYLATKDGVGTIKTDKVTRLGRVPEQIAFNVLLNGPHMLWQFEEIGYDISIDKGGRTATKPNPASNGYFADPLRVEAFTKCAQIITLRTQLLPKVFEGNPTAVNIGTRYVTRTVQWGSDVFAMANFSPSEDKSLELPSGTWYDYLGGGTKAAASYTLAPGEVKVFTGTSIAAQTFSDIHTRPQTPVETVDGRQNIESVKFLKDGRIYIRRGDRIYTITGSRVQ
jgi:hypothetical protein